MFIFYSKIHILHLKYNTYTHIMIATSAPLLSAIRAKGSTFYTFSSFLNDIDKSQLDSNIVVTPSRFACLNLPSWRRWTNEQTMFEEPANIGTPLVTDPNIIMPKVIQDYMENALALSHTERTDNTFATITESMLWKMFIRLGAMKMKKDSELLIDGVLTPVYTEDLTAFGGTYKPVVVYASDINVLNHITKIGQSYTEIFMHVPSQAAQISGLKFIDPGFSTTLEQFPKLGGPDYTVGLEDHPESNTKAVYDTIDQKYDLTKSNKLAIYWDDLDKQTSELKSDFEFNAIIVYYDIWDRLDESTRRTNIAGILFLDKFTDTGAGSYTIDTLNKYVPNAISTGNGYAIRLNLKTSANQSQTSSEVSINDYNSVSMELYMTALQRMNKITDLYEAAIKDTLLLKPIVDQMSTMLSRIETNESLQKQINDIALQVDNNQKQPRISNEELFEVFSKTLTETRSTTKSINVQNVCGYYIYDQKDKLPIVVSPDNARWKWNPMLNRWLKLL